MAPSGLAVPTRDELIVELMAIRYSLAGNTSNVWLCVDDREWILTTDRSKLTGVFARVTVGYGDSNGAIENRADDLLEKLLDSVSRLAEDEASS